MSDEPRDAGAGATRYEAAAASELARLVSYVILLLAAIGLFVVAGTLPTSQWEPLGAGAFPRLVMGLLAALSLLAIIGSLSRLSATGLPGQGVTRVGAFLYQHRLVGWMFLYLALYLALVHPLGFAPATFLFLLAGQVTLAPRDRILWIAAPLIALIFSFGLDWVFAKIFNVFLPSGPLG